jgi:hypothetical protein
MSLYREVGGLRRRRRLVAIAAAAVVVVAAVAVVLASSDSDPSPQDRADDARRALQEAGNGLELLEIEYAQAVRGGEVVAPTEYEAARSDLDRVRAALEDDRAALAAADARALTALGTQLDGLAASVRERASGERVAGQVADARRQLEALRAALPAG